MAKRRARPRLGIGWVATWPLMAAFAAMVFFSAAEVRRPTQGGYQPIGGLGWEALLPERIAAVTHALRESGLPLPAAVEKKMGAGSLQWVHRRFDVAMPRAEQPQAEAVIDALRRVDSRVTVSSETTFDGSEVLVGLDGLLIHTLRFHWQENTSRPRVAVVIGFLGDDLRAAREFASLDAPVALGVRPFRPFSREVAELGRLFNRDVVLHLPRGWRNDGSAGQGSDADWTDSLDAALASVPYAVGVATEMRASAATADTAALRARIERRGLFYVDGEMSGWEGQAARSPGSSAPAVWVLDAEMTSTNVVQQFSIVRSRAQKHGVTVAIGYPTDATLEGIRTVFRNWQDADVDMVRISSLRTAASLSPG